MPKNLKALPSIAYALIAMGLAALFLVFSTQCYFADSEIWLLTQSQMIFNVGGALSVYYKWAFHFIIYVFSHFAPSELAVYLWARIGCAALALASVALMASAFTRAFQRRDLLFPTIIFLLTSTLFFNQGFRIRADVASAFFHALIVWLMVRNVSRETKWFDHALLLLLNIILLSTGPKAVYFFLAQFVLGWELSRQAEFSKKYFWWMWQSHLTCVALIGLGSFMTYFIPALPNLPESFALALNFFIYKFNAEQVAPSFLSRESQLYVIYFFQRNWLHAVFLALGFGWTLFSLVRGSSSSRKSLGIYSFFLFLMALLHNDKLPFFLAFMFMPFMAQSFLLTASQLQRLPRGAHATLLLLLTLMTFHAVTWYQQHLLFNTNSYQKSAIVTLDKYTQKHPSVKIYDVIGLLPRKTKVFGFIGPGEEQNKKGIMEYVKSQKPDMILTTFKSDFLQPSLGEMLKKGWVQIEEGVWTKGQFISITETPLLFQELRTIGGKIYWVMRAPPQSHIYATNPPKPLHAEILRLDSAFNPTLQSPKFIAIPHNYLSLILSDLPPTGLLISPHKLFRFDTGF